MPALPAAVVFAFHERLFLVIMVVVEGLCKPLKSVELALLRHDFRHFSVACFRYASSRILILTQNRLTLRIQGPRSCLNGVKACPRRRYTACCISMIAVNMSSTTRPMPSPSRMMITGSNSESSRFIDRRKSFS